MGHRTIDAQHSAERGSYFKGCRLPAAFLIREHNITTAMNYLCSMNTATKENVYELLFRSVQEKEATTLNFVVPNDLAKNIVALNTILSDLMMAKNCIVEMQNLVNNQYSNITEHAKIVFQSSCYAQLVSLYGRCFVDAEGAKLEIKDCFPEGQERLKFLHEELMDLRHNFIAHRGGSHHEPGTLIVKVHHPSLNQPPEFALHSAKAYAPSPESLILFNELINYLIEIVKKKMDKRTEKIEKKIGERGGATYLRPFLLPRPNPNK